MLHLTLKQPLSGTGLAYTLKTVLSSRVGSLDPDTQITSVSRGLNMVRITCSTDGVESSTWADLFDTLNELSSLWHITLNLSWDGSRAAA